MPDPSFEQLPVWTVDALREPVMSKVQSREAIMERVRRMPSPRTLAPPAFRSTWRRRGLLTPVGSAAATALLTLAIGMRMSTPAPINDSASSSVRVVKDTVVPRGEGTGLRDSLFDTLRIVEFVLRAPGARSAVVVGNFNGWRTAATPMQSVSHELWRARVAVPRDVLRFSYIVNGEQLIPAPSLPAGL